jgi:hypothetical protein
MLLALVSFAGLALVALHGADEVLRVLGSIGELMLG